METIQHAGIIMAMRWHISFPCIDEPPGAPAYRQMVFLVRVKRVGVDADEYFEGLVLSDVASSVE